MKRNSKTLSFAAGAVALALIVVSLIFTEGNVGEAYSSRFFATVFSLLPAVVAITLALITKEVYFALFAGIVVGALLYSNGSVELALNTMLYDPDGGLVTNLTDRSHASILVFVTLLGTLVVLMNRSGGAAAFGAWAKKHIKTKLGAQLATIFIGLLIFVDDGFNCMTVGSVMRPITDSHNVSRAKLAYILDSTAAPVCIIAPISCWAAAVTYAVPESMGINGFAMFIRTIPYNLYALGTLFMLFAMSFLRFDYGPMLKHEQNAMNGDLFTSGDLPYSEETDTKEVGSLSYLALPVVSLIVLCILGMAYTGGFFSGVNLRDALADADSARGLVMGTLLTVLITFWFYMSKGVMSFKVFFESFAAGFRSMCAPMIILILSWNLSGMTGLLGAADFIHNVVLQSASSLQALIPAVIFAVSVFLAFATGTSWGTFTILIPIVCAVFPPESEMLVISISACLAGAVCGDHCSPISDTTIMSSAGAKCNHINHVTTQMPYALTVAGTCVVGYLISGIIGYRTDSPLAIIATPAMFLLLFIVLIVLRKRKSATIKG
ncbi:MAG: Na+/H+ antiporter NhaC family protein [Spirochaetales bacterium]|nr:Na+/H+ antiporter NhaC family protein [Spirochaetales bacterium]